MIENIKISYVIPIYNSENTILQTVESVVSDISCFNFKRIILIDDGSTDNSYEKIKRVYGNTDYIIILKKKNTGISDSLNVAIKYIEPGSYIFRCDSDDIVIPGKTYHQLSYMLNNNIDICGTNILRFGEDNKMCKYPCDHYTLKKFSNYLTVFAHPSICFSPDIVSNVVYEAKPHEDFYLWKKLSSINGIKFGNLNQFYLLYRTHHSQITKNNIHIKHNYNLKLTDYVGILFLLLNLKITIKDKLWFLKNYIKLGVIKKKIFSL